MTQHWEIKPLTAADDELAKRLSHELNISRAAALLLVHRGLNTADKARQFIRPKLEDLHDPFLMQDMNKAVERLQKAIATQEKILVYGDYDVDGTTAVALVYQYLLPQHPNIDYYIPDRYKEGYGISFQGIDYAKQTGCTLIIALDCGIRSTDKVEYATKHGIDFIICDHHLPGTELPKAIAVLDPKRTDCHYPCKDLCGCGVGFKLMQALAQKQGWPDATWRHLLQLTALSIASDIVPITDENRILAHYGLQQIRKQPSVGIECLMQQAKVEHTKINTSDLVYRIGPRINACGRIHSGKDAVMLLITDDLQQAQLLSEAVEKNNNERKQHDQHITTEALKMLKDDVDNDLHKSTVVCGQNWHKGVIGIVASRLTETYYRPTIVLTEMDGIVSGSARSVGGFDIYAAIDSCSDLLTNFGGHIFAAGLSMKAENYPLFKQRFEQYVASHILPEQQQPVLQIEQELHFEDITNKFISVIKHLEPFGPGNEQPVFVTKRVCNYRYTREVGKPTDEHGNPVKTHLRLDVTDGTGALSGIAFGKGELATELMNGKNADICYQLQENTYNGRTTIQMMVEDIKIL